MIARIVKIKCITGMEDQLIRVGKNKLVSLNVKAGCIEVHFLEPNHEDDNPHFGVISLWKDQQSLNSLRNNKEYRSLQSELAPLIDLITEEIYTVSD
ncbi:antibiotic biosynthesis monooxygenase family protein [Lacrimispora sp. 38-1]|uniref:antibiotic biosynthesis monooxygenase family protein n=1 Tax=Lacrimispora sp. 38-1 TaxID=3125778 RepID=UPI003CEDC8E0